MYPARNPSFIPEALRLCATILQAKCLHQLTGIKQKKLDILRLQQLELAGIGFVPIMPTRVGFPLQLDVFVMLEF